MSCISALHTQLVTLLSVPHEVLLFRHQVFKEYVKIAVGPDFIHTLPSFIVLAAMVVLLWRNPPRMTCAISAINQATVFRSLQVFTSWILVNGVLWLWLIFQRILYCFVWSYWSYDSEYRETVVPWWQRVWSSYYPPPLQPPLFSAGFISWIISMIVSIGILGYATSPNRMQNLLGEGMLAARDLLGIAQHYINWSTRRFKEVLSCDRRVTIDDSEISSMCDDCRSDMSADVTHVAGLGRREVHPISYGTNWTPRPTFSGYKEAQRKYQQVKQTRSPVTVTGGSTVHHDNDDQKLSPKQLRHRRGCHTVVPSNSSDKSSGC